MARRLCRRPACSRAGAHAYHRPEASESADSLERRAPLGLLPFQALVEVVSKNIQRSGSDAVNRTTAESLAKRHKLLRIAYRERPEQKIVDEREDRRVRTDPQRQRNDSNHGEAGVLRQHAQAVAHVLPKVLY